MPRNLTAAGLTLALAMMAGKPGLADTLPAPGKMAPATGLAIADKQAPAPPLVPAGFKVPTFVKAPGFKIVPLGPDVVTLDYAAYMSSIDHLQKTFSRSKTWPHTGISASDAMRDMEGEQARFQSRKSFAYAVLTPDGRRERGSIYVSPSSVEGYDAVVRMWVTQADHDSGFDAELYRWVVNWIRTDWPFTKVAYPGRAIDWNTWDALVAANKARSGAHRDETH